MASYTEKQTISMYILPSISSGKDSQTMRFVKLIEYNVRIFFLKNHTENEAGQLVPGPFFLISIISIHFCSPRLRHTIQTNCINIQTIDPEICST